VFTTVGVDPEIEFVDLDMRRDTLRPAAMTPRHPRGAVRARAPMVAEALAPYAFAAPFRDREGRRRQGGWPKWTPRGHAKVAEQPLQSLDLIEARLLPRLAARTSWSPARGRRHAFL
jgi:hypothetical protein